MKKKDRLEEQAEEIRRFGKKLVEQGPHACRKFLISTGIYNDKGELKEEYK